MNNELLTILQRQDFEEKPVFMTAREAAHRLREWKGQFSKRDLRKIADLTEEHIQQTRRDTRSSGR